MAKQRERESNPNLTAAPQSQAGLPSYPEFDGLAVIRKPHFAGIATCREREPDGTRTRTACKALRQCDLPTRAAGQPGCSAPASARTFAPAGRRTVKTEPLPGSLVTVTSPPIMRASLRVMARPRPVPP